MAVAVAVASGLADCGLGIRSAASALASTSSRSRSEEYDLVLRRDFADAETGRLLIETIRSPAFRDAVRALGGYDVGKSGQIKSPAPEKRAAAPRAKGR